MFLASCSSILSKSISIFLDSEKVTLDDTEIAISSYDCTKNRSSSSYFLDVDLQVKNLSYSTKSYKISDAVLKKESTNATYSVQYTRPFNLEAEMDHTMILYSNIPSKITDDNYTLSFKINNTKVTLGLYETPDSLREDRTINYYIDGKLVNTQTKKDKRKLSNLYTYEYPDHSNSCSLWRIGPMTGNRVSEDTIVTENLELYGYTTSNFKWTTTSSDAFNFLTGINYVPSDKILVVPSKQDGKEICISNYGIQYCVFSKIYLPKTIHRIYNGNFTNNNGSTIYYEGTSEEWAKLFYNSSDIVTDGVVYNTKSPY